ncbi:hypothetical protein [Trebonia kvetii]|nr:hypothetical protein [Trebonia kvetii]
MSDNFAEIMDITNFVIPEKAMDPAVGMFHGPEWDSFLRFKKLK